MKSLADRGEPWFTQIYEAHFDSVLRYGMRRLGDVDASAELAQEVFVVAWRRRAEVPDNSLPWLYGVARRLLANQWRAHRANPPARSLAPDGSAPPASGAEPDSIVALADLRAALARLPQRDQEILRLIGWEQLTVVEAAQVLGCTRTAAKVRLHRARRRLAAAMATPVATLAPLRRATHSV